LAKLVFLIDILYEVRLIDDVDQVPRFGNTPEHPAESDSHNPRLVDV
jgi:hypothetical protein